MINQKNLRTLLRDNMNIKEHDTQVCDLLRAKNCLRYNDIKGAINHLIDLQAKSIGLSGGIDDLTKIANTLVPWGDTETTIDILLSPYTMVDQTPPGPKGSSKGYLSEELFPQATGSYTAGTASGIERHANPKNCTILKYFSHQERDYYLVKRNNGRLVCLCVETDASGETSACIHRTGHPAQSYWDNLSRRLNKE